MVDLAAHLTARLNPASDSIKAIAVALSGGADSWTLALLSHDYAQAHGLPFMALTVDHRLRNGSEAEAAAVAGECAKRGIPHATLVWRHDGVATRRQERARAARYDLLAAYCGAHGFDTLLTAHHADDQAETVLLRFAKASGAKGLAGMAPSRPLTASVTLHRPLLEITKEALAAHAAAAGVPVMADPSNADPRYARARLRAARDVLAAEGLTTATLLKVAAAAQAENAALDYAVTQLLYLKSRLTPDSVEYPLADWDPAPLELKRRALQTAWTFLCLATDRKPAFPPERDKVAALIAALKKQGDRRTLGGMIVERTADGIRLCPEVAAGHNRTIVS